MFLKKVEIFGFKSFADETKIEFRPGITALVGPNGCGKTNIVDAIRWCLGENNPYNLRAQRIEDLIFSGSQTRPPLNLARVSVTFDNTTHFLPLDWTEVVISRRLYRSGESQYFINKSSCRLKDIQELFMDTGIGKNLYSIMQQEDIDFIINSKPEEKRFLFEETAGVVKYIFRREEAERKLEKTKQNLLRLQDILSEINHQLNSLRYQATRARNYQQLLTDLKAKEIAFQFMQAEKIQEEIKQKSNFFDNLKDEITKTETKINQLEIELEKLQIEKDESERKISLLKQDLFSVSEEIARQESKIKINQERLTQILAQIEEKQKEIQNQKDELKKIEDKIFQLKNNLAKISNSKIDSSSLEQLQKQLDEKRIELFDLLNLITKYKNQKTDKLLEKERVEKSFQILLNEQNETINQKQKLEEEIKNCQEKIIEINSKIKDLEYNQQQISLEKEKIQKIISEVPSSEFQGTREILKAEIPGIYGTVEKIIFGAGDYSEEIKKFLGERLYYLICNSSKTAINAISYLKNNNLGFACFLPLENFSDVIATKDLFSQVKFDKKFASIAEYLLKDVKLSDDKTIFSSRIIAGGSINLQEDSLNQEIKKITQDLDEIELQKVNLESFKVRLVNEKKEKEINLKKAQDKLNTLEIEKQELIKQKEQLEKQFSKITEQLEEMDKVKKVKENELESLNKKFTLLYSEYNQAIQERIPQEKEISRFQQMSEELNLRIKENTALIDSLKYQVEKFKTVDDNKIDLLYEKRKNLDDSSKKIQQEILDLISKIKELEKQKEDLIRQLTNLRIEYNRQDLVNKNLEKDLEKIKEEILKNYGIEWEEVIKNYNFAVEENEILKLKQKVSSFDSINMMAPQEYEKLKQRYDFLKQQEEDLLKASNDLVELIEKTNQTVKNVFNQSFSKIRENFKKIFVDLFEGGEADLILTSQENILETGIEILAQPPGKKLQNMNLLSAGEKTLVAIALLFSVSQLKPSPFCILDEVDSSLDEINLRRFLNLLKDFSKNIQYINVTHNKSTMEISDVLYGITMEELGVSKIVSIELQKASS